MNKEKVLKLMKDKDAVEKEIANLYAVLGNQGVGMDEPLVDSEGYPLGSVNLYEVRLTRQRINCLQNDHKAIMKEIEKGLQEYYSSTSDGAPQSLPMEVEKKEEKQVPFAKVTLVSDKSPAQLAGISVNDEIVAFGSVNASNFRGIADIANIVQHSENAQVTVRVKRDGGFLNLGLTPRKWQGQGLLGCKIVNL